MSESELVVSLWNGTVPAEAMLLGIPVVAYDTEYMREIYPDELFYVENNVISDLARKIKEVLLNPEEVHYKYYNNNILRKIN